MRTRPVKITRTDNGMEVDLIHKGYEVTVVIEGEDWEEFCSKIGEVTFQGFRSRIESKPETN